MSAYGWPTAASRKGQSEVNRIEALRAYVEADPEPSHTDYLLFEVPHLETGEMQVGVIYCDDGADYLDDHCAQCRDEVLPFGLRGDTEELPSYLVVSVGPRKFARIKAGWRDSEGMDLKRVRFVP